MNFENQSEIPMLLTWQRTHSLGEEKGAPNPLRQISSHGNYIFCPYFLPKHSKDEEVRISFVCYIEVGLKKFHLHC